MKNYLKKVLLFSILILLVGQFDPLFFRSYFLMGISLIGVLIILILRPNYFKTVFSLIIISFIISHFRIYDVFGSLAFVVATILLAEMIIKKKTLYELKYKDNSLRMQLTVLIIFNLLGWIVKSRLNLFNYFMAGLAFFILLLLFNISSKLSLDFSKLNVIIYLIIILSVYGLFTSLINGLGVSPIKTPIFGGYQYIVDFLKNHRANLFGQTYVSMIDRPSGELGLIYFSFLFTIYLHYNSLVNKINLNRWYLLVGVISAFFLCIVEFSKSHTIVLFLAFLTILTTSKILLRLKVTFPIGKIFSFCMVMIMFYFVSQSFVKYDYIFYRFEQQPELFENVYKDPLKASNTSRSESWGLAYDYISKNSFIIGYGYANGSKNRIAWLGPDNVNYPKLDYHNFIYSLIPIFGWFGAISFLLIILISIKRVFSTSRDTSILLSYRVISLAFFYLMLFFMLGELSICAFTSPHYMVLFFILLGICNALYFNRFKYKQSK